MTAEPITVFLIPLIVSERDYWRILPGGLYSTILDIFFVACALYSRPVN